MDNPDDGSVYQVMADAKNIKTNKVSQRKRERALEIFYLFCFSMAREYYESGDVWQTLDTKRILQDFILIDSAIKKSFSSYEDFSNHIWTLGKHEEAKGELINGAEFTLDILMAYGKCVFEDNFGIYNDWDGHLSRIHWYFVGAYKHFGNLRSFGEYIESNKNDFIEYAKTGGTIG
jgi:hypothetical protein